MRILSKLAFVLIISSDCQGMLNYYFILQVSCDSLGLTVPFLFLVRFYSSHLWTHRSSFPFVSFYFVLCFFYEAVGQSNTRNTIWNITFLYSIASTGSSFTSTLELVFGIFMLLLFMSFGSYKRVKEQAVKITLHWYCISILAL